ncbi:SRPBCC family protein [Microlunatus ginsengisoli]|uniref:Polyketide cyclase / dehydrase and lipid transport n=1 Tax=Microlunatus ginsengisoli TaxID=363863 RepID=A0ABP6ZPH6_9ACTN
MPTISAQVTTSKPPEEVLRILTDFSPARADAWPGVDLSHLQVHDSGEDWVEVTEGNDVGWERERYSWDAAAGTVTATTVDSNLWAPGSRWDYTLTPSGTGTTVDVTVHRTGKGVKGKLVGVLLLVIGKKMITGGLNSALNPS